MITALIIAVGIVGAWLCQRPELTYGSVLLALTINAI